jgi:hypothetical protein
LGAAVDLAADFDAEFVGAAVESSFDLRARLGAAGGLGNGSTGSSW